MNQTIEAFVYCVLGAQVNTRNSILGDGGRAKQTQSEFLVLMEDAIRTPGISKSVQRYQLAIDEAKVRLDFATNPGTWLMPSRMVINTESTIGYNNQLKQATPGMKLGVNNNINLGTKKGFTAANGLTHQTVTHQTLFTNKQWRRWVWTKNKVRKQVLRWFLRRQKRPPLRRQKRPPLSRQTLKSNRIT